jgi:hypothetical protein
MTLPADWVRKRHSVRIVATTECGSLVPSCKVTSETGGGRAGLRVPRVLVLQVELDPIREATGMAWRARCLGANLRQFDGPVVQLVAAARFDNSGLSRFA